MTAKIILVVLGLTIFHHATLVQSDEDCLIGRERVKFNFFGINGKPVNDNHGMALIESKTTSGIEEITSDSKWLNIVYDKTTEILSISTKEAFKNYEDTEVGTKIEVEMTVQCKDGYSTTLTYYQPITDLNTFEPEWSEKEYVFVMYGSLYKHQDLSNLMEISVTDKDCSPDELIVSLEYDNKNGSVKEIGITKGGGDGKKTPLRLYVNQDLHAPFEETYTMRVKDRRTKDAKESSRKLTVKLDKSEAIFEFTKPTYTFNVQDRITLLSDEIIQLSEGLDHDVKVTIEDFEYSKYFSVVNDYLTNSIRLILNEALPIPQQKTYAPNQDITLTLKAEWQGNIASTKVDIHSDKDLELICYVPGLDITLKHYLNPKKMNDTATSKDPIYTLSGIKNVADMSCDDPNYLECKFEPTMGEFNIFPTKNFEMYENLEEEKQIRLNLTIQCPYNKEKNMIFYQDIIDTNNHVPTFTSDTYNYAFYNEIPESFDVTGLQEIKVTDEDLNTNDCNFKIVDNDDFKISSYSSKIHKECKTILSPKQTINPPFNKTFFLDVEDGGTPKQKSRAKIHVVVQWDLLNEPKFTQPNYLMKMHSKGTTVTALKGYATPKLENGIDSDTKLEFVDTEFESLFRLKFDDLTSEIIVELRESVVLCQDCESISFKIKAMWRGLHSETLLTIGFKDGFETTTAEPSSSESSTDGARPTTTETYPFAVSSSELPGFAGYILTSWIIILILFVITVLVLSGLIVMIIKRFFLGFPQKLPL